MFFLSCINACSCLSLNFENWIPTLNWTNCTWFLYSVWQNQYIKLLVTRLAQCFLAIITSICMKMHSHIKIQIGGITHFKHMSLVFLLISRYFYWFYIFFLMEFIPCWSFQALIDSTSSENSLQDETGVRMVALFDHEEVGSNSAQGAGSPVMLDALSRITSSFDSDSKVKSALESRSNIFSLFGSVLISKHKPCPHLFSHWRTIALSCLQKSILSLFCFSSHCYNLKVYPMLLYLLSYI